MENASFLVTGGCGLQGSHIVEKLKAEYPNAKVAVMTRNPTVNLFPGVDYHKGDVTSREDIRRAVAASRPTVVFHCAGVTTVNRKPMPDAVVRAINLDGTRYMLDESVHAGAGAFVFTSSASVVQTVMWRAIANGNETMPMVTEEHGIPIYPTSKAAAERLVLAADNPSGMRTTALRPAVIYGERDTDLIPNLMKSLRAGRTGTQVGDNTNVLSFTYSGNSADAHLLAASKLLDSSTAGGVAGEAFFVTNSAPVRFWDFSRAAWRLAGDTTPPESVRIMNVRVAMWYAWVVEWFAWLRGTPPAVSQMGVRLSQMTRWYDISKARERLGYEPKIGWQEGLQRSIEWYLENERKSKPLSP